MTMSRSGIGALALALVLTAWLVIAGSHGIAHAQGDRRASTSLLLALAVVGVGRRRRDRARASRRPTGPSSTTGAAPGPTRRRIASRFPLDGHRPEHLRRRDAASISGTISTRALRARPTTITCSSRPKAACCWRCRLARLPAALRPRRPAAAARTTRVDAAYWLRAGAVTGARRDRAAGDASSSACRCPATPLLFAASVPRAASLAAATDRRPSRVRLSETEAGVGRVEL